MSTQLSRNQAVMALEPPQRIQQGEQKGRVHAMYDEFQPVAAIVPLGDTIKFQPIPAGARVTRVALLVKDQGTVGSLKLGWQDNGVDGVALDGFIANQDIHTADSTTGMDALAAGFGKKFSADTTIVATMLAATDASSLVAPWQLIVEFVLD